jgi:NADPH:quinone reductase
VRAVVCGELGALETLAIEEVPSPSPGEGQVVVDVRAAGVNFVDGLICQGRYQIKPATPFVPGSEIAGDVTAVGAGVSGIEVGDKVIAFTGFGGFAEQVAVPALSLVPMPSTVDYAQAATLIQSYCTMLFTLTRRTTLAAGEWVLILGAGGGIGLAAVDVARALGGRVIAAASSPEKLEAARGLGAEAAIAYEEEDLKTRAREIAGGGVDVVIDPVGGKHSEAALRATRHLGRFCVIGFASGPIASIPLNQILLNNRTAVGVDWGGWTFKDPLGNRELIGELMAMVEEGRLHPVHPVAHHLDAAAPVMSGLIERSVSGKVVLVP